MGMAGVFFGVGAVECVGWHLFIDSRRQSLSSSHLNVGCTLPRHIRVPIVSVAARHALYAKARMWACPIVLEHAHRTPIDAVALDPECDSAAARRYR